MVTDFTVSAVNRTGRTIIFVTGEIDLTVGERFRGALRAAQEESTDVIIDFTGVTFIDSTAIHALIGARMAAADESRVRVVGARPSIRRVFEITGITDLLLDSEPEM